MVINKIKKDKKSKLEGLLEQIDRYKNHEMGGTGNKKRHRKFQSITREFYDQNESDNIFSKHAK